MNVWCTSTFFASPTHHREHVQAEMRITFFDTKPDVLTLAVSRGCGIAERSVPVEQIHVEQIHVEQIRVEQLVAREVVRASPAVRIGFISAANSFGFMDGGSDKGYMSAIPDIQTAVQKGIRGHGRKTLLGRPFLPIGCAMAFEQQISQRSIMFIVAPTMQLPEKVVETRNPYHALLSALVLCKRFGITDVFCPMMCTGYGGQSLDQAFGLMSEAVAATTTATVEIHTVSTQTVNDARYTFAMLSEDAILAIHKEQPQNYANTEFYRDN